MIYGIWYINKDFSFPGKYALLPVVGSVLLISAGPKAWINHTILSNKVAIWFGLISYPLYLWHWPLLSFLRITEEVEPDMSLRVTAILLAVILASLTYYFVEKPIRNGLHDKFKVFILLAISISLILISMYGFLMDGFPKRKGIDFNSKIELLFKSPYKGYDKFSCEKYLASFETKSLKNVDGGCVVLQNKEPSVLFVGDSHSIHYANSISSAGLSEAVAIIQGNNCLPFSGNNYMKVESCKNLYDEIILFFNKDENIKTIVFSAFWAKSISGKFASKGINWRLAAQPNYSDIESFLIFGRKLLKAALKKNRKVVFMHDIPILDFDIKRCFDLRPLRITEKENFIQDCSIHYPSYMDNNKEAFNAINLLLSEFPGVEVYDPKGILCEELKCKAINDGRPIYLNGDHVNVHGGNLIINDMISKDFLK